MTTSRKADCNTFITELTCFLFAEKNINIGIHPEGVMCPFFSAYYMSAVTLKSCVRIRLMSGKYFLDRFSQAGDFTGRNCTDRKTKAII